MLKRNIVIEQKPEKLVCFRLSKGDNSRTVRVLKLELDLSFMIPDLVYQFQMVYLKGTKVLELKPNKRLMYMY